MMIGYLILAHNNLENLLRLIKRLSHEDIVIAIHLDIRVDDKLIKRVLLDKMHWENVYLLKERFATSWGTYEIIEATLSGLSFLKNLDHVDRIILLSGNDYPIKTNKYISNYIQANTNKIFMEHFKVPYNNWSGNGIYRFPFYEKVIKMINIYGGSQWISFPRHVIDIIFEFLEINPDFSLYFKSVLIPDESFFQTLLLNCDEPIVLDNIVNRNLHLIKWDSPYMNPRTFTIKDKTTIRNSKFLFARKFDPLISSDLLDYIDNDMLNLHLD